MGVSDNFSAREPAGTLSGTEVVALWKDGKNVRTTTQDIADLVEVEEGIHSAVDSTTIDFSVTDEVLTGDYKFQPTTAGTVEASKVVVVDANKDATGFNLISTTGTQFIPQVITAASTYNPSATYHTLNNASTPITKNNFVPLHSALHIITQLDTGTAGHTLILGAGNTFDGINVTATFNAKGDTLVFLMQSDGRGVVLINNGVVLS